jgi:hypothetical protein
MELPVSEIQLAEIKRPFLIISDTFGDQIIVVILKA